MIELIRNVTDEVLRDRLGSGVTIERWGSASERTWSWQFSIRIGGTQRGDLLLKIPRWPEASTLELAVNAGEQASTVSEFEALTSIAAAVSDSGDSGLTAVETIAYIPEINGILMRRLEGRSLRQTVGFGMRGRDGDVVFSRVGRLVSLVHHISDRTRRPFDGAVAAAEADRLSDAVEGNTPAELGLLLRRLAAAGTKLEGVTEPVGNVHGDLNMSNVLVDKSARVAVIDPNPGEGPQLVDVALLGDDIRFDRRRLVTGGWPVGRDGRDRWAAAVAEASGVRAEAAWPFRRALVLGERWLRIESETVGVRRVGLLPARGVLSRELRRRVAALAG
jgi:aminoglycoside phosphotransferase (APT) family kinase protein